MVNGFQPLTNFAKTSILNIYWVVNASLQMQKSLLNQILLERLYNTSVLQNIHHMTFHSTFFDKIFSDAFIAQSSLILIEQFVKCQIITFGLYVTSYCKMKY